MAEKLTVGQEVRVFDVNGRRVGQPEGGWPGEITRIGRVLVTISYRSREETFRIEGGRRNDNYGHQSFLTLEETDLRRREGEATDCLRRNGLDLNNRRRLTLAQLEAIAAIVSGPQDPDPDPEGN